jgi:hypothetical protein
MAVSRLAGESVEPAYRKRLFHLTPVRMTAHDRGIPRSVICSEPDGQQIQPALCDYLASQALSAIRNCLRWIFSCLMKF